MYILYRYVLHWNILYICILTVYYMGYCMCLLEHYGVQVMLVGVILSRWPSGRCLTLSHLVIFTGVLEYSVAVQVPFNIK